MVAMDIDSIVGQINKNYLAKPQYYQVTISGSNSAPNTGVGGKGTVSSAGGLAGNVIGSLLGATSPLSVGINSLLNNGGNAANIIWNSNGKVPDATPDVMMNCSALSIPGIDITFAPDKRYGLGTNNQYPTAKNFTALNMTFYESQYENERAYFSQWVDMIYNKSSRRWGYYNDYVKTITISQYDRQNTLVYSIQLLEAYPVALAPLSRGYALDAPAQFDIGFQFSDMVETFVQQPAIQFGLNLATLAQVSQIIQSFTGPNAKNTNISGIPGMPQIIQPPQIPTIGGIGSIFPNLL
jgi:hypothetical protein